MLRSPENPVLDAVGDALARAAIRPHSLVLVGLSGGADSVALLHALLELRERFDLRVAAGHLNHGIRASESDRDEKFVRAMSARLGVELVVERADGLDASSPNLEERARDARREFLVRAADSLGANYIALAHHADDQAETVLMRLLRGSGAAGLSAMSEHVAATASITVIRPMLTLTRAQILDFVRARRLPFVEDSSNSLRSILRNRLRLELIPMLEREYAPGFRRRLVEVADEMRSLDELVTAIAAREFDALRSHDALDVSKLALVHRAVQPVVIRLFLAERIGGLRRISRAHVDAILRLALEGEPSASYDLPHGYRAEREYNLLRIVHLDAGREVTPEFSQPLKLDGATIVDAAGFEFRAATISAADISMPEDLFVALFDAAAVSDAGLVVRNFILGDRISPLGMSGERKVKEVFIDRKLARSRRGTYPIVTLGREVVWIPGFARARAAIVTKSTEAVVRVEARENVV